VNDKGLSVHKSFSRLAGTIQEMCQNLMHNEEKLNLQKEELRAMREVRRKVSEYQKQAQADHIKRFNLMELKRFQVILSSGENLMEEAGSIISEAKKECDKIWESAGSLMDDVRLPRIETLRTSSSDDSWIEAVEARYREKKEALQRVKELRWEDIKVLLIDEVRSQTRIEMWTTGVEMSIQKRVMKSVCQSNLTLEGYRPESLVPLIEAHD